MDALALAFADGFAHLCYAVLVAAYSLRMQRRAVVVQDKTSNFYKNYE